MQSSDGSLPLPEPMNEIAGKLDVQVGAYYMQRENGGSGVLLGGVAGIKAGNQLIEKISIITLVLPILLFPVLTAGLKTFLL